MAENVEGKVTNKGKLIDKNKLFFGLIHYILSEQKNVNWLIRSSLIDITGVSNVLEEKPYKRDSILQDVVDYITEMKPYHVQFSHYFEHYQTASETVNIPGKDWIEPTYNLCFDALQSYPDINKIFYSVEQGLPTAESASERKINIIDYNEEGLTIFNMLDKKFYVRHYNEEEGWIWVESDEKLSYNGNYTTTRNTKKLYKVIYDNGDTLKEFNSEDLEKFLNAHRANRLFYIKYWGYSKNSPDTKMWVTSGINDFEEIKKELNANFKGIEINGSVFDIEKFGYDIFNYDTTDYDSPTVIYDYYFVNKLEDIFENQEPNPYFDYINEEQNPFTYKKEFVSSSEHRYSLTSEINDILKNGGYEAVIFKCSSEGNITEYFDYEFTSPYNYIDIFHPMHDKEKTYIVVARQSDTSSASDKLDIKFAYVLESTSFSESTSDVLKREIVYFNPEGNELAIPSSEIASEEKIAIEKEVRSGTYQPYYGCFDYVDGKIITRPETLNIYDHIIMTAFDYKYLYDKIYTWEDRYGRSNNIVNLDGMGFLRARYEDDRPSEKVVSYPLNTLFIKKQNYKKKNDEYIPETSYNIFMNDFKNQQTYTSFLNNTGATLCKDPDVDSNGMITSLYIDNINNFEIPSVTNKKPCMALINSEIIEYKTVNKITDTETNEEYWELTNLNRGLYGSTLFSELLPKYPPYKMTHSIGDKIIPYIEDEWFDRERSNVYKSYNVIGNNISKYNCPTGYKPNSVVEVTKLPKINLLEDVTGYSTEIVIDSPNVVSGWIKLNSGNNPEPLQETLRKETTSKVYTNERGYFSLKINDDEILFKSIYKDRLTSNYHLTNIILPTKYINYGQNVIYKATDSFVYSCIPENIENFNVNYIEGDFVYDMINVDDTMNYIYIPVENTFIEEDGISCTDEYLYFKISEDDIVDGKIKTSKSYPVYDMDCENLVTISNESTEHITKEVNLIIYNSESTQYEDNLNLFYRIPHGVKTSETDVTEDIDKKEIPEVIGTSTYVQMFNTEPTYSLVDDVVVENPTGINIFKIKNNDVYIINTTFNSKDTFKTTENYFGFISNNYVYKSNGDAYAKIEEVEETVSVDVDGITEKRTIRKKQFVSIQIIVTINEPLKKGESIHINVIN